MTRDEVLAELATLGSASIKKTLLRHGAKEPFFGVKVGDLKKLQKRLKGNHALALELYDTGNTDAMYLAGLIADPKLMKKADLQRWVKAAYWYMLAEYTVAWITAESQHADILPREWIDSKKETIASAGWNALSSLVSLRPDDQLDLPYLESLLTRVQTDLAGAANRVRYTMNGFVIAVGGSVVPLTGKAREVARALGQVQVDMGDTACQVPAALATMEKIESMGRLGKKRKTAFC